MSNPEIHAANKKAVVTKLGKLFGAPIENLADAVADVYASNAKLFAFHPVNEHDGSAAIADDLWRPIRDSFPDMERRNQIVIAGGYDGRDFVCSYSDLQGTFQNDWLDIPASHGVANLRSCRRKR